MKRVTKSRPWVGAGVPQILAVGLLLSACSRLDDGVQRSSFITVILDEMQRKGSPWDTGVTVHPSDGAWPFSVEETIQQLREDGFRIRDESRLADYLIGDCSWGALENGSIVLNMDNSWDHSRFHYWVFLDVSAQCQFEGLTAKLMPEDGPIG